MPSKKTTITAADQFTDWLPIREDRKFNLSISGTFTATVTLQRRFNDDPEKILDVETFTAATEKTGEDHEGAVQYRLGSKTGEFTSGPIDVRVSQ